MENTKLFQVASQGYNCTQVDKYIAALKGEYKKLYEYSKNLDSSARQQREKISALTAENEKLSQQAAEKEKKILELETALSKTGRASEATEGVDRSAEYDALLQSVSTMQMLSEEVVRENKELRARLAAIKAGLD